MRIMQFTIVTALLAGLTVHAAERPVSAIFISHSATDQSATLLNQAGVVSATPVFDSGERDFLQRSGQGDLAASIKLEFEDRQAFERLRKEFPKDGPGPKGVLQLNSPLELRAANPEQWGLNNTGAPQQIELTDILARQIRSVPGEDAGVVGAPAEQPGHKILVAVIDTGVDAQHPALKPHLHRNESECRMLDAYRACIQASADKEPCHLKFARLDTDGNGYPLDCSGWSVLGGPSGAGTKDERTGLVGNGEPLDDIGHGTHVSGIIGAQGVGNGSVNGIASEVEILPVKVIGKDSGASTAADDPDASGTAPDPHADEFQSQTAFADVVARGILYAIRSHAQVMNLSLGYSIHDDSELMRRMVGLAQAQGILVVAAAGNESSRTPVYPCRYAGVICVGSFSADGSVSHFSDFGDAVDLAAPGHKILSTWPGTMYPKVHTERRGYDFLNGTSMASPFVAGALARLLNHGFAPSEAYARLILGARPHLEPTAMPELSRKFTLSGNLDLKRAFEVTPQPLILPALKDPVLVPVDRMRKARLHSAPFQLSLKNFWRPGSQVQIQLAISSDSPPARAQLSLDSRSVSQVELNWAEGETRKLEGEISWAPSLNLLDLPGDFYFEVTVSGPGMAARTFKKSAEFFVPIRPLPDGMGSQDPSIEAISSDLKLAGLPADYAIKPISCLDSASDDLLLVTRTAKFTTLQVLAMSGQGSARSLQKRGADLLDQAKEKLFTFSCLDFDRDGSRNYAVTSINTADKKFVVSFFDSGFRPMRALTGNPPLPLKYEFAAETVPMAEDFRWLSGAAQGSARRALSPAWIGRGRKPKSELVVFDPWEARSADQVNPLDQRFYVLSQDGLHTIAPPEGFHYVTLLKGTSDELRSGSATVLLFKGLDYQLDFYTAEVRDLKLGVPSPLGFDAYHRLAGLKGQAIFANGSDSGALGTAFSEGAAAGQMRVSVNSAGTLNVHSTLVDPLKPGDFLTETVGVFAGVAESFGAFIRSRYQLYYFDQATRSVLGTDLKQYDGVTRHLPAQVDGLPALVLPEGQGSGLMTEVIVPRRLPGATSVELVRPAGLKAWGLEGCEPVQLLSTSAGGAGGGGSDLVGRVIYFCDGQFVRMGF